MPHVPQQLAIEPARPCVQTGHRPGRALRRTLATAADWPDGNHRSEGDPRQRYTQALLHFWSAIASLRRGRTPARAPGRPLRRARCLAPCHTPAGCFNQRSRESRPAAVPLTTANRSNDTPIPIRVESESRRGENSKRSCSRTRSTLIVVRDVSPCRIVTAAVVLVRSIRRADWSRERPRLCRFRCGAPARHPYS